MRAHIVVHGRVQGVGFRYAAKNNARIHGICGWVRNLDDGTVELEIEGTDENVESFVRDLTSGFTPFIRVDQLSITTSNSQQTAFDTFDIK